MIRRVALVLAALLAGCAGLGQPVDTAQLPAAEFAGGDRDISAVNYAAAAFSNQSSTYGNPAAGAEAALALDYAAGALNTAPRWTAVDPAVKDQLLQGRAAMRAALGVAPGASSQALVDALSAARLALQADDQPGALAALRSPVFTGPPEQTLTTLGNLPYLQPVNAATLQAAEAVAGLSPTPDPVNTSVLVGY